MSNTPEFDFDDHYEVATCPTDDPRLVALIHRDSQAGPPDGCGFQALLGYEWGSRADFTHIGDRCVGTDVTDAWERAYQEGGEEFANRFVRVFCGADVFTTRSTIDQYTWAVIFMTPDLRKHCGIPLDREINTSDDIDGGEVQAYLDADVYGIGWAFNPHRTTTETPVPSADEILTAEGWAHDFTCWGFYGYDWACQAALEFEHGRPDMDTLMDMEIVADGRVVS